MPTSLLVSKMKYVVKAKGIITFGRIMIGK